MPAPLLWPLLPDPTPPQPIPPAPLTQDEDGAPVELAEPKGQPAFLGRGLMRPFRRDERNDWHASAGDGLVLACVGQVLGTKADSVGAAGELPWRTDFGSRVHLLRHRNNHPALADLALVYAAESIGRWEPRAAVTRVEPLQTDRKLALRVYVDIVDRQGRVVSSDRTVTTTIG